MQAINTCVRALVRPKPRGFAKNRKWGQLGGGEVHLELRNSCEIQPYRYSGRENSRAVVVKSASGQVLTVVLLQSCSFDYCLLRVETEEVLRRL